MSNFTRLREPGGTYFFTAVTHGRRPFLRETENVTKLREAFRFVMIRRPFKLVAIVVLPDHIHCIWKLPADDCDYSTRWQQIKSHVSRSANKSERPVWQPRFWEHLIRNPDDLSKHLDYIHFNPVKHGLVEDPALWPHSSFERFCPHRHVC